MTDQQPLPFMPDWVCLEGIKVPGMPRTWDRGPGRTWSTLMQLRSTKAPRIENTACQQVKLHIQSAARRPRRKRSARHQKVTERAGRGKTMAGPVWKRLNNNNNNNNNNNSVVPEPPTSSHATPKHTSKTHRLLPGSAPTNPLIDRLVGTQGAPTLAPTSSQSAWTLHIGKRPNAESSRLRDKGSNMTRKMVSMATPGPTWPKVFASMATPGFRTYRLLKKWPMIIAQGFHNTSRSLPYSIMRSGSSSDGSGEPLCQDLRLEARLLRIQTCIRVGVVVTSALLVVTKSY